MNKLGVINISIVIAFIIILFVTCQPVKAGCTSCGHEIASDGTCPCTNLKEKYGDLTGG